MGYKNLSEELNEAAKRASKIRSELQSLKRKEESYRNCIVVYKNDYGGKEIGIAERADFTNNQLIITNSTGNKKAIVLSAIDRYKIFDHEELKKEL